MKSILESRPELRAEVEKTAEVAGYLWQNGWAERNGGNITVNITRFADDDMRALPPISDVKPIGITLPFLKGCYFYCKGTGKRMRDLARWPMQNGSVIRILDDCASYVIIADEPVMPTSELPSHLAVHNHLIEKGSPYTATVHTHPIELVAMSHNREMLGKDVLTNILWSMIPETKAFCPLGHSLRVAGKRQAGRRHAQGTRRLRRGALGKARRVCTGPRRHGRLRPD